MIMILIPFIAVSGVTALYYTVTRHQRPKLKALKINYRIKKTRN